MSDDPIAAYVGRLARALPGPRRVRAELLDELASGLHDAADAHVRAGLPPAEARTRAVTECGLVGAVAPGFRAELVAAQCRRTAMLLALAMPGLVALWDVPWRVGGPWDPPASWAVHHLADVTNVAGMVVGVAALLALGALGWSARYRVPVAARPSAGRVALALWVVAVTGLVVTLACSAGMAVLNPAQDVHAFTASWLGRLVLATTFATLWCVMRSLGRTLSVVRHRDGATRTGPG